MKVMEKTKDVISYEEFIELEVNERYEKLNEFWGFQQNVFIGEYDDCNSSYFTIVRNCKNIDGNKIGVIIDRIARVVSVNSADVKAPPQMLSGIGTEYIQGVIRQENGQYLIMLDIRKLFDAKELQNIIDMK